MNEFDKYAAITQLSTIGNGALTGLLAGGLQSLSRTDDGARLAGGAVGGSVGGATASLLPAAFLRGKFLRHYVNTKGTLGAMFNVINFLLAAGGSTVGSKIGENTASVIKNSITGGKKMFKSASLGSNALARMFGKAMGKPMGRDAFNYLKAFPNDHIKGVRGINTAIRQAKRPGSGVSRATIDKYLAEAKARMAAITDGPRYNPPWSFTKSMFGNDMNLSTPQELLNFVKKMNA